MTHIVWNGRNGYDTIDNLRLDGVEVVKRCDGRYEAHKGAKAYISFACEEIDFGSDEIEFDSDGDAIPKPGQYMTTDFRFWREI